MSSNSKMNSLSQGQRIISERKKECRNHNFNNTNNTPYQGVEQNSNISLGITEGFTGMLGKTAANDANAREAEILKSHKTAFDRALSDYASAKKVLDEQTAGFINSVKGAAPAVSNDRSGSRAGDKTQMRVVKWADNKMSVITDKGIVKPMSEDTWNKIKGNNGCPTDYEVNSSEALGNPKQGEMLGTSPNYYVGSEMKVQSCHKNSGINARVMGAINPMDIDSTYKGSFSRSDGMGSMYETQNDVAQAYGNAEIANSKLTTCASRAADLGRTSYGVWLDDNDIKCAIAPADTTWKQIIGGKDYTKYKKEEIMDNLFGYEIDTGWSREVEYTDHKKGIKWDGVPQTSKIFGGASGNSMSLLFDGRLVKSNIPNKEDIMYQDENFNDYEEISSKKMSTPSDPIKPPGIKIENATYGGNCNGQENRGETDARVAAWQMRHAPKPKKDGGCTIM